MQLFEDELFGVQVGQRTALEGKNVLKASLFTLIVLAKDVERTMYCQKLVHLIARKFPCKIIFLSIDTGSRESFLRQTQSTRILGNGSGSLSCDVFFIQASLDQVQQIPFLVIPEISADLPTFLLVGHDPAEIQSVVDDLEPYASRVAFDATRLSNVGKFAERILALPNLSKYVDLHWARTKPWRETLARVFNSPESLEHLRSCSQLEIRYGRNPTAQERSNLDTQAILLQAWIASRLRWEVSSVDEHPDHLSILYHTPGRETTVVLMPTDSEILEDGGISSIELRGSNDVHYLMTYERDDRHITIHASSQDRCEMPYTLFVGSFQRGRALPNEIFQQAASEHYAPTLDALISPCWNCTRSV